MDRTTLSDELTRLAEYSARFSPTQYCQAVFVFLAVGVLAVNALPANARRYLLDYGARENKEGTRPCHDEPDAFERVVAVLAYYCQVPHAWFSSFYIAYLTCAAGWLAQWLLWRLDLSTGAVFALLTEHQQRIDPHSPSMSLVQVCVASGLEALQAARRLYEHVLVFKSSKSQMNVAHWLLGMAFYICMSMAVWIEGSEVILAAKDGRSSSTQAPPNQASTWTKLAVGTALFFFAWLQQYRCHVHLASLKKYSLPEEGMFRYIVCPHYTCECIIYLALSILAAPAGLLLNRTLLPSVFFVIACLGITASRTRIWYCEKFGEARLAKKWTMIPLVF